MMQHQLSRVADDDVTQRLARQRRRFDQAFKLRLSILKALLGTPWPHRARLNHVADDEFGVPLLGLRPRRHEHAAIVLVEPVRVGERVGRDHVVAAAQRLGIKVEAPNINSSQMRSSFGDHETRPGRMLVASSTPESVRAELRRMGYRLELAERTSGPINALFFDRKHRTIWGGSSHHGEDYGIAW
jgi:hypothetical protein